MKRSTAISLGIGGALLIGGSIWAYIKREALKQLVGDVVEEAKKRLPGKKDAPEETATE